MPSIGKDVVTDSLLYQLPALWVLIDNLLLHHTVNEKVRADERKAHVFQHTVEVGSPSSAIVIQPPVL